MKVGVCGIACEVCPRMIHDICPNGEAGCQPKDNKMCAIATCAFHKGVEICFRCSEFPCEITKSGPISYGYCQFISGRE
ncbi:MAG: DUF3795 domain-containing protein [Methanotrichaceae archaeon]|nr:DUF3795 domain-containing protein [Methanotrichaceae archaeon]